MLIFFVLYSLLTDFSVAKTRPNIITIVADDLGWNDVGFHGQTQILTPNIDALAYSGVSLSRHYTLPVCSPSRSAFLTGFYPLRTGIPGALLPDEKTALPLKFKLLPEYLKDLGYQTHLVGKWHLGHFQKAYMPTMRGFDNHLGYLLGFIDYFNHTLEWKNNTGFDFRRNLDLAREYTGEYATHIFTNESIRIINEHDSNEPLFLQIAHLAAHYPLEVPSEKENDEKFGYISDINRRRYAGLVSELDNSVGKVIDALKTKGILNNTIILFISDNGAAVTSNHFDNYGSNYPLRGQKFTLFEGGIRGVAALWAPNLENTGRIYSDLIHLADWLPTLYAAAGGDIKDLGKIDGIDQWDSIRKDLRGPRTEIILNIDHYTNQSAYLKDGWKLIIRDNSTQHLDGHLGTIDNVHLLNATAVVTSLAAKAFVSVGSKSLNDNEVIQLSKREILYCRQYQSDRNINTMLFNIYKDPCEKINLANRCKKKLEQLLAEINYWNQDTLPLQNTEVHQSSYPALNGGAWGPWLD